ncbi:XPA protein C-terminus-domain-containing protein [Chaetomium tenue]|uniref:XPA protein C-terminus-domain-containing protein n=1 Tax=Chaetomium tenue TaxID=1854479 RepID=A0ACB7NU46_9PEZI|nr:XPA protein C-terminus-domain-containing protein [Chaetomium globosum]
MDRPGTPPQPQRTSASRRPPSPPTPEVTRRIEESRLRAKAIRDQRDREQRPTIAHPEPRTASGFVATDDTAGKKRPYASISRTEVPATNRDARTAPSKDGTDTKGADLLPMSRKFSKYVDYNFSAMTDTKGGFLSTEDDPWNKSMSIGVSASGPPGAEQKPAHMSAAEWERMKLLRKLQRNKSGPFEPSLSVLADEKTRKRCRECRTVEIDFVWEEVFGCAVCNTCKEKYPEKYSLLTKTECKEDYLLTEPELKDDELLPHLSKPNPHKAHWHDMMLFLRYQVEDYAFKQKWGSVEALDAEFEKREVDKKRRKEAKFKEKLLDLKRKTRTDAFRRNNAKAGASAGGGGIGKATKFGDAIGGGGKHVHEWGRTVENEDGMTVKTCVTCNMEVEELEL